MRVKRVGVGEHGQTGRVRPTTNNLGPRLMANAVESQLQNARYWMMEKIKRLEVQMAA
jgi:hypothetical protein